MKPLLISSGEPAGIGPDICLGLVDYQLPIVVLADKEMLAQRAQLLNRKIELLEYNPNAPLILRPNTLTVSHLACLASVIPGQLNSLNSPYVMSMLKHGTDACLKGEFSALVTAPVHKAIINQAGIPFTGHTEFLAHCCGSDTVVMMLACKAMKVALITTHLPLRAVPSAINLSLIITVISRLNDALKNDFGLKSPRILVAGLNPHAGEGGYLGSEENDIIIPALRMLQEQGINVEGPYSADTLFTPSNLNRTDAFVAMYHDQGLTVLKYAGFGQAVNITLGLPIIRTSVDHGTALEIAGSGQAEVSSLHHAVTIAMEMAARRVA